MLFHVVFAAGSVSWHTGFVGVVLLSRHMAVTVARQGKFLPVAGAILSSAFSYAFILNSVGLALYFFFRLIFVWLVAAAWVTHMLPLWRSKV